MAALACPLCLNAEGRYVRTEVYDTRRSAANNAIVRHRRCPDCRARLTTCEQIITVQPAAMPAPRLVVAAAAGS